MRWQSSFHHALPASLKALEKIGSRIALEYACDRRSTVFNTEQPPQDAGTHNK